MDVEVGVRGLVPTVPEDVTDVVVLVMLMVVLEHVVLVVVVLVEIVLERVLTVVLVPPKQEKTKSILLPTAGEYLDS